MSLMLRQLWRCWSCWSNWLFDHVDHWQNIKPMTKSIRKLTRQMRRFVNVFLRSSCDLCLDRIKMQRRFPGRIHGECGSNNWLQLHKFIWRCSALKRFVKDSPPSNYEDQNPGAESFRKLFTLLRNMWTSNIRRYFEEFYPVLRRFQNANVCVVCVSSGIHQ